MTNTLNRLYEKINYMRPREIEGILHILLENPGISNNKLIQMTGLPKETLKRFKSDAGFILKKSEEDSIYIREDLLTDLKKEGQRAFNWSLFDMQSNNIKEATDKLESIRKKYSLNPVRSMDQFFATPATSINKALIIEKKGVLDNAVVALMGDDDLVAVSLNLINSKAKHTTVFDVDKKLLSAIETISQDLGTNRTRCVYYDAIKELPSQYKGEFDVVVIDPPYTKAGVTLFLNRAIDLVGRETSDNYIFLYFGTSIKTPEKTLKIQEIITQMGLVIDDRIDRFARYEGAESMGDSSALYILKTSVHTAPLAQIVDATKIYTNQKLKEDKFPYVDHVVFKLFHVPAKILNSKTALEKSFGDFCRIHRLKVVDEKLTKFGKNGGMTLTYVLASSNLVAHTWPEMGALHIDLITCSPIFDKQRLGESLKRLFNPGQLEMREIE